MRRPSDISLSDKVLLAALECSQGDLRRTFTAEALLIAAWIADRQAFGLRGHEENYPDSNKLYTKIDGRDGLVAKGLLRAEGERTLQITEAGLGRALTLSRETAVEHPGIELEAKVDRALQEAMSRLLGSAAFRSWLEDHTTPRRFRDIGSFWGIAPGTPPKTVRERVTHVDQTLATAWRRLEELGVDRVVEQRSRQLFDREDLRRLIEFQSEMKQRFQKDLNILDPEGNY